MFCTLDYKTNSFVLLYFNKMSGPQIFFLSPIQMDIQYCSWRTYTWHAARFLFLNKFFFLLFSLCNFCGWRCNNDLARMVSVLFQISFSHCVVNAVTSARMTPLRVTASLFAQSRWRNSTRPSEVFFFVPQIAFDVQYYFPHNGTNQTACVDE